jgi:hypothetical protein
MIEITIHSEEETESGLQVCYTVKSAHGTTHCSDIVPFDEDPTDFLEKSYR